jgi:flagellar hook-associated protein 2
VTFVSTGQAIVAEEKNLDRKAKILFSRQNEFFLNRLQLKPTTRVPINRAGNPCLPIPLIMTFQVAGLASNFDWKSFVDQIIDLERTPATRIEAEKTANSRKVTELGTLGNRLDALKTAMAAVNSSTLFGLRTAQSTTSGSQWTSTAASNAPTGSYKIAVSQLATAASLRGAGNVGGGLSATSDVSALTVATLPIGQAISAGEFTVNGQKVSVALTDSLQDVFTAIATATGGTVTASYSDATDRVTLASSSGEVLLGASNDTSNFLRAMKLGNNGTATTSSAGGLGTVKTSAPLATANLAASITAVDGSGNGTFSINGVEIAYNVNTDPLSAILTRINDSGAGVNASYDATNDRLVLVNQSTGDLGVSVSEAAGGLLGALGLTTGATLARGKNAEFTINDGGTLSSASNTLDGSSHGITGLSVTVNSQTTETISVAADTGTMRAKVQGFIDGFNAVQQFLESATRVTTDSKGKVTAATLSSNREIQEWGRTLRTMAFAEITGATGQIKRLADIGIDFKTGTNELEIKSATKFDQALSNSTAAVDSLFTKNGTGLGAKFDEFLGRIKTQNTGQQERLNKANTGLDEQIAAIERRLVQQRSLLESAFIQMETAQSRINQQQSAIAGMFPQTKS